MVDFGIVVLSMKSVIDFLSNCSLLLRRNQQTASLCKMHHTASELQCVLQCVAIYIHIHIYICIYIYIYIHICVCIATHCNTLQHTATHCNTLQHTIKTKDKVQMWLFIHVYIMYIYIYIYIAVHCNTLQYAATHCSTLQYTATHNQD